MATSTAAGVHRLDPASPVYPMSNASWVDVFSGITDTCTMNLALRYPTTTQSYWWRVLLLGGACTAYVFDYLSSGLTTHVPFEVAAATLACLLSAVGYCSGMVLAALLIGRRSLPPLRMAVSLTIFSLSTAGLWLYLTTHPPSSGGEGNLGAGLTVVVLGAAYAYLAPLLIGVMSVLTLIRLRGPK
jgi:hypothetical protein